MHTSAKNIVVLASREPHVLRRVLNDAHVALVLANHADLESVAREAGAPFKWKSSDDAKQHFEWLASELREAQPDLVVLARYMRILPPDIVAEFRNRIINVHPSLLPHFPGPRVYERAIASGVRISGATAHFVTDQLDEGPVIHQDVFHINIGQDTEADVRRKGLELEASVLGEAMKLFLDNRLEPRGGKVIVRPASS